MSKSNLGAGKEGRMVLGTSETRPIGRAADLALVRLGASPMTVARGKAVVKEVQQASGGADVSLMLANILFTRELARRLWQVSARMTGLAQ